MTGRFLRILFIAFQAVWLNAVVPGHARGVVTLGGDAAECASCDAGGERRACCAHSGGGHDGSHSLPTPARQARCAVCAFAARITPPPVIDLRPPRLALLCVRPVPGADVAESSGARATYNGRAPPADC